METMQSMQRADTSSLTRKPSPGLAWSAAVALSATWGVLRLVVFNTIVFPLTYALPLLVCVWTRNVAMVWTMAAVFVGLHTIKQWWILPAGALPVWADWATYLASLVNITVAALVVHAIIRLRDRLDRSLEQVCAQADELERQNEELLQQSGELTEQAEELSQQVEEISQQSEELAVQNEELQAQSEEIQALNTHLGYREALLQTLFDAARRPGAQQADAVREACAATLRMVGAPACAIALYEWEDGTLALRGTAAADNASAELLERQAVPDFATLVIAENRTASLSDAALRPDLLPIVPPGAHGWRSALSAPLRANGVAQGALMVYAAEPHEWTVQQFRTTEWVSAQAAHVLEVLRLQEARERAEAALRTANAELADADRRKNEFLATLSHELRNPLVPIRYALEVLNSGAPTPPGVPEPTRVIERQLGHLVRLVDDLLDISRIASDKVQLQTGRIALTSVVEHAVEATAPQVEQARHTLAVSLPTEPVWLEADAVRLSQVLTNLLTNAVRYTPAGGEIALAAERIGDEVAITVTDTGVGLTKTDARRVFDMFAQVGEPGHGGLGIGLAVVKRWVELHGGTVVAESDGPGKGSRFIVRLPVASPPPSIPDVAQAPAVQPKRRILVVDDNVDSAQMLRTFLETCGHEVHVAFDGVGALTAAARVRPDVCLFDIGLPGLDGYELARQIRQDPQHHGLYLIALTGWGQEEDRQRAQAAGFDAHLTKPTEPDAINALLLRATQARPTQPA